MNGRMDGRLLLDGAKGLVVIPRGHCTSTMLLLAMSITILLHYVAQETDLPNYQ